MRTGQAAGLAEAGLSKSEKTAQRQQPDGERDRERGAKSGTGRNPKGNRLKASESAAPPGPFHRSGGPHAKEKSLKSVMKNAVRGKNSNRKNDS